MFKTDILEQMTPVSKLYTVYKQVINAKRPRGKKQAKVAATNRLILTIVDKLDMIEIQVIVKQGD